MIYEHSTGAGATVDSIGPVLEMLAAGCILAVAREAAAREHDFAHTAVPVGLRDPILVVGLPNGWRNMTHEAGVPQAQAARYARVYSFCCHNNPGASGVRVNRSLRCSIRSAIDFILAAVH